MNKLYKLLLLTLAVFTIGSTEAMATPPAAVTQAGYNTETFVTNANFSPSNVDMKLTNAIGYQWYFYNFFSTPQSSALTTFNADGSVTLGAIGTAGEGSIVSATLIPSAPYYRGTAFGGGGYFEATLSFDPASVNLNKGWPAWWTYSLEHTANLAGQQWPGQSSGYEHFIEPDVFEADMGSGYPHSYGGTMHDWYGQWGKRPCSNYCNVQSPFNIALRTVPSTTNFNQYHRYGLLWIPATATKSGSLTYYFDGAPIGQTTTYTQLSTKQAPPPTLKTPWTFGVIDQQHLILILNGGDSSPLTVQSVQVWQASTKNNLTH